MNGNPRRLFFVGLAWAFAISIAPRALAIPIVGVTTNNQLVRFDSATPGSLISSVAISGLQPAEKILGIDYRPLTGALYGFGNSNRLYTLNPNTGAATLVGSGLGSVLAGSDFGFDFNPVVDRIRVVSDAEQNVRLNPDVGTVAGTDTTLAYASGDPNFGANPNVTAVAYGNNFPGTAVTTLYGIDTTFDILVRQGGVNGTPLSPNSGQLFTIGALGINAVGDAGFDIHGLSGTAFAALTPAGSTNSRLFTINLSTGAAALVGTIGGIQLRDIAIVPAGVAQFGVAYTNVNEGASVMVPIVRTGGSNGTLMVNWSTTNGSAASNSDYSAASGTVTFADGDTTTKFIALQTLTDAAAELTETVGLLLTPQAGQSSVGPQRASIVAILDAPPLNVIALTTNNQMFLFDAATPGNVSALHDISLLAPGEIILGIDFRWADGQLYGVSSSNRLYRFDLCALLGSGCPSVTIPAIAVTSGQFTPFVNGTEFGFDLNPVVDRFRLVSDADQNLRLNPANGTISGIDTTLAFAAGDPNFGANPNITGVACDNNYPGATATTLYGIDSALDVLVTQGGSRGVPSANSGQLFTVGPLGVDTGSLVGFDIMDLNCQAYASLTAPGSPVSGFYQINLTTGAALFVGNIGGPAVVRDIAMFRAGGLFRFGTNFYNVDENAGTAAIDVFRSSTSGVTSVNYATSDGTALAGADYLAVSGRLVFGPGETNKSFTVPILRDAVPELPETINLSLSLCSGTFVPPTPGSVLRINGAGDLTVYALSTSNRLFSFTKNPEEAASHSLTISGLLSGEKLLGIDFRPANGALYGLGSSNRLYVINTTNGAATLVGGGFSASLMGAEFGFDFNPVPDRIRVVSDADQDLRLNPNDGTLTATDTLLAYASGDTNFGVSPTLVGSAYINNFAGTTVTTLYGIDSALDVLVRQGSVNGTPLSPNSGQLFTIGPLGVNTTDLVGFDYTEASGAACAALTLAGDTVSKFYSIDLNTGAASFLGSFTGAELIRGLAVAQPVPSLNIARSGNQALLSWPASAAGYILQSTLRLPAVTWSNVVEAPGLIGNRFQVTNSLTGTNRFYRLAK